MSGYPFHILEIFSKYIRNLMYVLGSSVTHEDLHAKK